jgi:choice-of-anchor A domain-containing protein
MMKAMKLGAILLACVMIIGGLARAAEAAQTDPGSAGQFAVLSLRGTVAFGANDTVATVLVTPAPSCPGAVGCAGDAGGVSIMMPSFDVLPADALASHARSGGGHPAVAITIGARSAVGGQCVSGGGSITGGSACAGGTDISGTNSKVTTLLPSADTAAGAFAQSLAGLTATQTLAGITLNGGQSYVFTTHAGVNVIDLPSLITRGSNQITIAAGPAGAVVINQGSASTPGQLQLGAGTQILLSGGITPDRVIFNVSGAGATVAIAGGSIINGTILAASDSISAGGLSNTGRGTTINGALIAGQNISLGCKVTICFYPFAKIFQVQGSCLTTSSLAVLVQGKNVSAYVPKANWTSITTGVSAVQIEGSGTTAAAIATVEPGQLMFLESNHRRNGVRR